MAKKHFLHAAYKLHFLASFFTKIFGWTPAFLYILQKYTPALGFCFWPYQKTF